jgi:F0F1-type ATP synthase membrane subunit b/b'
MINNLMADQTQEMIDGSAEMKAMLNDSGYDDATIEAILQEARDGNRERLDTMLGAVDTYMGQDLETANKELDEMLASTATSIEELN